MIVLMMQHKTSHCKYTKNFPNIKYYKNKINIGGRRHFQLAFQKATGEYISTL